MHTSYGHCLRVPSEALQRSRGGEATDTVDMITSVFSSRYLQNGTSILEKQVLGVWVGHQDVNHLSEPISITFWRTPNTRTDDGRCVFWDDSNGDWSSEGCLMSNQTEEEFVCSCNHLSFFAVMLLPQEGAMLSPADYVALHYIHLCGSIITCILATLTCLLYLRHRRRLDHSGFIHQQLALSLLLLHIHFLLSAWWAGHTQGQPITVLCRVMGAGLHYSLMVVCSWMAVEGFHLYLLLVRVFNIYISRYRLKVALFAWGLPVVSVVVCAALNGYGHYEMKNDSDNYTDMCWLQVPDDDEANSNSNGPSWSAVCVSVLRYLTVEVYLALLVLGNSLMLAVVASKLCGRACGKGHHVCAEQVVSVRKRVCRDAASVLVLSWALGLPWALGFTGHFSLTSIYLFSILNASQGVCVFLWCLVLICKRSHQMESSSQNTIKMSLR
ncbi:adhesion G-protein coupled receptor G5-like [Engraulis encrasicolus]|uniref:adhesion G-protein coupled receptor G5-like n=1 Tax=Engraulis encrasicolus TaxID=184585 RepID=UPI002FD36871